MTRLTSWLWLPRQQNQYNKRFRSCGEKAVMVPERVEGIAKCVNPKCITNNQNVRTKFDVVGSSPIVLKCHYCEKLTDQEHIVII